MRYNERDRRIILPMGEVLEEDSNTSLNKKKVDAALQTIWATVSDVMNEHGGDTSLSFIISLGRGELFSASMLAMDELAATLKQWASNRSLKIEVEMFLYARRGDAIDDLLTDLISRYAYADRIFVQVPCNYTLWSRGDFEKKEKEFSHKNKIYLAFDVGVPTQAYDEEELLFLIDVIKPVDFAFVSNHNLSKEAAQHMKQTLLLKRIL